MASDHPRVSGTSGRRRFRYKLGSLLSVIAGLAILMGLLVPTLKTGVTPVTAPLSHVQFATAGMNVKNCVSCHQGKAPGMPPVTPPHPSFSQEIPAR